MRIIVNVKPGAKKDLIEKIGDLEFQASVRKIAREGEANAAVVRILSKYLGVPRSALTLVKGQKSRKKIFDIQK